MVSVIEHHYGQFLAVASYMTKKAFDVFVRALAPGFLDTFPKVDLKLRLIGLVLCRPRSFHQPRVLIEEHSSDIIEGWVLVVKDRRFRLFEKSPLEPLDNMGRISR